MTIADSTRSTTSTNEPLPAIHLCWRVAGRLEETPITAEDRRPTGDFRLLVRIDPGVLPDTGICRAWLETGDGDVEILESTHVDIQRVLAHGWTHLQVDAQTGPLLAISLHEGQLRYIRTDLPRRAGLPGGSYEAPSYREHHAVESPPAEDDPLD